MNHAHRLSAVFWPRPSGLVALNRFASRIRTKELNAICGVVNPDDADAWHRRDTNTKMNQQNKIYVGNLSFNTSDDTLSQLFSDFGAVNSATVCTDRETGRSRGFGFVEMSTPEGMNSAIESLNGQMVEGRNLTVNIAKPREDSRGGRGRR